MKKVLRREIFIETERIVFLAKRSKEKYLLCEICEVEQFMFPPALIAEVLQISSREIYKQIETKRVHFFENDSFQLFVCPNSLAKCFRQKEKLFY